MLILLGILGAGYLLNKNNDNGQEDDNNNNNTGLPKQDDAYTTIINVNTFCKWEHSIV